MKRKILLLEDDDLLSQTIIDLLEESYSITHARDGAEALEIHYAHNFDLYLLDIKVPYLSGDAFLQYLRQKGDQIPAIFITSNTSLEKLKKSFAIGADDYIKKPFDIDELQCRIEAVLRRYYHLEQIVKITQTITYDFQTRTLLQNGEPIYLAPKIIKLLELLLKNHNRCTPIEEIVEHLWHPSEEFSLGSLRIYINKLRNILGKERIKNIKGEGYSLIDN